MVYNDGYDDEAGDYIVREGDIIHERYKISVRPGSKTPLLGKGSFGQVAYAYDLTENLGVAIKVVPPFQFFDIHLEIFPPQNCRVFCQNLIFINKWSH